MEPLIIESTYETPQVNFNPNGIMEISGRSLPENADDFYEPLLEWLEEYLEQPAPSTKFICRFIYFNTLSSKLLLDILINLQDLVNESKEVLVNWYYKEEGDDMKEAGEEYQAILSEPPALSFNIIKDVPSQ